MNFQVTVNVEIGEASREFLAGLLGGQLVQEKMTAKEAQAPVEEQAPVVKQAPVVEKAPVVTPVTPTVPVASVPTNPVTYTQEQLALATTTLVDANRVDEVYEILAGFGVQSLIELPAELYGEYANKLRAAGVKI